MRALHFDCAFGRNKLPPPLPSSSSNPPRSPLPSTAAHPTTHAQDDALMAQWHVTPEALKALGVPVDIGCRWVVVVGVVGLPLQRRLQAHIPRAPGPAVQEYQGVVQRPLGQCAQYHTLRLSGSAASGPVAPWLPSRREYDIRRRHRWGTQLGSATCCIGGDRCCVAPSTAKIEACRKMTNS